MGANIRERDITCEGKIEIHRASLYGEHGSKKAICNSLRSWRLRGLIGQFETE
jgi:hypothetical protein